MEDDNFVSKKMNNIVESMEGVQELLYIKAKKSTSLIFYLVLYFYDKGIKLNLFINSIRCVYIKKHFQR